jgi:hypothetical protein
MSDKYVRCGAMLLALILDVAAVQMLRSTPVADAQFVEPGLQLHITEPMPPIPEINGELVGRRQFEMPILRIPEAPTPEVAPVPHAKVCPKLRKQICVPQCSI